MRQRKLQFGKTPSQYSVWLDWDKPVIGLSSPGVNPPDEGDLPIESCPGQYYIVGILRDIPLWMTKTEAEQLASLIPRAYVDERQ
jgi:hypothetical protein